MHNEPQSEVAGAIQRCFEIRFRNLPPVRCTEMHRKDDHTVAYQLPELGYDYDALEPAINTKTMMLHHGKHHQAYIHQLNMAIAPYKELQDRTIEDLLMHIDDAPEEIRGVIRNSGGGHANHELY